MPDTRQHRGPHPSDRRLFDLDNIAKLRTAIAELSWLLSRDYATTSALKLVGDRHGLCKRQRIALSRAACSDQSRQGRTVKCVPVKQMNDQDLVVDGFNLLITLEAALGGGAVLICRDGCFRDLSGVHGSYRTVQETLRAITLIGNMFNERRPRSVEWLLDKPVSNSGRLAEKLRTEAELNRWPWTVRVVFNPDRQIISSEKIAITSDSSVLDGVTRWMNVVPSLLTNDLPKPWVIDLRESELE